MVGSWKIAFLFDKSESFSVLIVGGPMVLTNIFDQLGIRYLTSQFISPGNQHRPMYFVVILRNSNYMWPKFR